MSNILEYVRIFLEDNGAMISQGIADTLFMTFTATFAAYILGLPLGILSEVTRNGGIRPRPILNKILGIIINIGRSVPFIILLVAVIPLTRLLAGTTIGPKAATVPLIIAAVPFIARLVETSLREVDNGVIEAAKAMGATDLQIIFKVMIPESLPSLILGASLATITVIGYTAMAGTVGGRGLGDIAQRYGYHRYQPDIMFVTIVLLIILVQIVQNVGHIASKKIDKRGKGEM
ncbi:methionine ABC transporter permease [Anaerocolumna cellulosilytica]|uniref:Methionine ABC transporter permease n=1 Tax=Anaerocolumna cellulosilytica TaxID=433286 RepID=A0A6S6R9A5_9FIRM|nr:methionine ABC transporter permease [Anaerocolumna cellulosilytica]MBB5197893.1 D-methionine transport system permease protein [Anaerocolumna cellulosilytica]BCJ95558.1 methionine ABC transporter permease [Anaerocolumna cellulosilytica]